MEKSFIIQVLNVKEPPVSVNFTDESGQYVNENSTVGTIVGTLKAIDNEPNQNLNFNLDVDTLKSFSLTPANCSPLKNTTVCTTQLQVNGNLDYEVAPVLQIDVRVTDRDGLFIVGKFSITVVDNNDQPNNVTISGSLEASVPENNARILIGELVTSDQDHAQHHSYNLLNNSNLFEVKRNRFLYLKGTPLDFEQKDQYVVMVTSTDDGSPKMTSPIQSFTVHVTDVNEAPTAIYLSDAYIPENSALGTIIGNFTVQDPDNLGTISSKQTHVCHLTESALGKFQIISRSGHNLLSQRVNTLDYEKATSHNISVLCTDPFGLSNETGFVVHVSDVNEAPLKVALSKTQVVENIGPTTVGVLTTQDPDNANNPSKQSFQYTLRSQGLTPFTINGSVLNSVKSLNFENAKSWTIIVRAQDNGSPPLYRDERLVIDVLDDNDKPSDIQVRGNDNEH